MGTQIKSPIQFFVQVVDHLGMTSPPQKALVRLAAQLGQDLFYPPNVKGWDGGKAWINANTLLMRYNMPMGVIAMARKEAEDEARQNRMDASSTFEGREGAMKAPSMARREPIAPRKSWTPKRMTAALDFSTAGECIDAIADHFFSIPLTVRQKTVLAQALGVSSDRSTPLRPSDLRPKQIFQTLRLVFGMADYQLC